MYALLRSRPASDLVAQQLPTFVIALVIAEVFYKLGSFSLECIAFLATWFALDFVWQAVRGRWRGGAGR